MKDPTDNTDTCLMCLLIQATGTACIFSIIDRCSSLYAYEIVVSANYLVITVT